MEEKYGIDCMFVYFYIDKIGTYFNIIYDKDKNNCLYLTEQEKQNQNFYYVDVVTPNGLMPVNRLQLDNQEDLCKVPFTEWCMQLYKGPDRIQTFYTKTELIELKKEMEQISKFNNSVFTENVSKLYDESSTFKKGRTK